MTGTTRTKFFPKILSSIRKAIAGDVIISSNTVKYIKIGLLVILGIVTDPEAKALVLLSILNI